jgi:hypothetical protein
MVLLPVAARLKNVQWMFSAYLPFDNCSKNDLAASGSKYKKCTDRIIQNTSALNVEFHIVDTRSVSGLFEPS